MRDILATFYAQVRSYDPKATLISWKNEPYFSCLADEFPTDIAAVAKYFNGYRSNIKPDKRTYMRICIHTPNSEARLFQNMNEWCRLYGYTLTKCVIQAENSSCIGWLCYLSQYTDTEPLKTRLKEESNFEWGFKLVSTKANESEKPWM